MTSVRAVYDTFGKESQQRSPDESIRRKACVPVCAVQSTLSRLKYLKTLIYSVCAALFRSLAAMGGSSDFWVGAVICDLVWLKAALAPKLDDMPDPKCELHAWLQFIKGTSSR